MMILSDVREWLKGFTEAEHYYIGKLDNKQNKSVGVYQYKHPEPHSRAIGSELTYDTLSVSLLVHWNENARESELTTRRIYEKLRTIGHTQISSHEVYMLELYEAEPVSVDTDDKGIYEWVIDFKIYYEIGVQMQTSLYVGLIITIWLIINETISILENLGKIGIPLPSFLLKLIDRLKNTVENKTKD